MLQQLLYISRPLSLTKTATAKNKDSNNKATTSAQKKKYVEKKSNFLFSLLFRFSSVVWTLPFRKIHLGCNLWYCRTTVYMNKWNLNRSIVSDSVWGNCVEEEHNKNTFISSYLLVLIFMSSYLKINFQDNYALWRGLILSIDCWC